MDGGNKKTLGRAQAAQRAEGSRAARQPRRKERGGGGEGWNTKMVLKGCQFKVSCCRESAMGC
jgi:hypothetical protein